MFRCRRLYQPMALLSMAMACSIVGYLVILRNDTSVHRILSDSREDLQEIQARQFPINNGVTHHHRTPNSAEFEKLGKIAALLDIDILGNDSYKDVESKVLQIETILEKFRTKGDDTQANNVLEEIRHLILPPKTGNEVKVVEQANANDVQPMGQKSVTQPTNPKITSAEDNIDMVDILEHIEDLLEQPEIPPPPVPNVKLDIKPYIKDRYYKPSQCPQNGLKYAEHSPWFKTRYIPDIKVFMDKEDVNNFTNFYKLSHYGLPFGVKGQDRRLMARVLNNPNFTNPNIKANRPQCVRCAVVGSGGVLNGSNVGPEIDAHDYVFRVNRALTKGKFSKDVGERTSFYTFFPESQYVKEIQDKSVYYFYAFFKPYDMEYALNMLYNDTPPIYTYSSSNGTKHWNPPKPVLDVSKLKVVHPDFMRYVFTRFLDAKAYRPTTGALVAFLAVHLCDQVSMYGFGYDNRFPIHYYDTKKIALTKASVGSHDVDNERILWRKLNDENIVHFFNRTTA